MSIIILQQIVTIQLKIENTRNHYLNAPVFHKTIIMFYFFLLCSNFNADNESMNNGMSNSMGRGNNRPRGTSGRGRGSRHDFYNNGGKFIYK